MAPMYTQNYTYIHAQVKLNVYCELSFEGNVGSLGKIYVHFTEIVGDFPQEVLRESAVEKKYDPQFI